MATKKIVDAIPPVSGREYKVTTLGNGNSKIEDVTQYEQEGSTFGAKEVLEGCFVECDYSYSNKIHTVTSSNVGAKNIKFYSTNPFYFGDTLLFNGKALNVIVDGIVFNNPNATAFNKKNMVLGFIVDSSIFIMNPQPKSVVDLPILGGYKRTVDTLTFLGFKGFTEQDYASLRSKIHNEGLNPQIILRQLKDDYPNDICIEWLKNPKASAITIDEIFVSPTKETSVPLYLFQTYYSQFLFLSHMGFATGKMQFTLDTNNYLASLMRFA